MTDKRLFPGFKISRNELKAVYRETFDIFTRKFGHAPRANIKQIISDLWDEKDPHTEDEYISFYRNEPVVAEELADWYVKNNYKRTSRAQTAGAIALDLGCKSFAEFGCGLSADAIVLSMHGLVPIWLGDICIPALEIVQEMWQGRESKPQIVDLVKTNPKELPTADLLFASDSFEHLHNPETTLSSWIGNYKTVIVYAPFNNREGQHQHTTYPAQRFHSFMRSMGFQKIVYKLAIPPFVYTKI